ncbi:hypothetical protein [uncultured Roseovarius sp.]|uniref:hypothetical protein n=1 Tax=uncultured Roseovarius sp. TaxID=293344 RepID=UPI00261ACC88|nr:hypothetical protein [uncultured Roseovarius sp.]
MDVILHLGAHRTASTSFQHYMRANTSRLEQVGVGFWGPLRTRDGILTGVMPCDTDQTPDEQLAAAQARILQNLDRAEKRGITHLVVSDENVVGSPRNNLRKAQLYGGMGERMARYSQAFGGRLTRLVLSIRSQDMYWSSVTAFAVARGHKVLRSEELARLASGTRQWRDVITDLACAVPDVEIQVHSYEVFGGMPERRLAAITGLDEGPSQHAREWLNRAPGLRELREIVAERGEDPGALPAGEGRWHPFDRDQVMALREAYADDLYWLRAGADGLATLIEETASAKAGKQPSADDATRGQTDGKDDRRLA